MNPFFLLTIYLFISLSLTTPLLCAVKKTIPQEMHDLITQKKYAHSFWGIYVKDLYTGEILFDKNSNNFFSPASTTKLFSIAALLHTYGEGYRFKTPVYSTGKIENGELYGNIILAAQGDLTMGGRESSPGEIAFTKLDHTIANEVPGVILTREDPLNGLNELAKQIYNKGIRVIYGDIIIDDSLFETISKREMVLTPIIINENLIDIVIKPTTLGQKADVAWRPKVPGYEIENQITTVSQKEELIINIHSDESGRKIRVQGTIPIDQHEAVRTFPIKDPKSFALAAFIQALEQNGIKVHSPEKSSQIKSIESYEDVQQVALLTSPPLSEYAKLILKVSHNLGADLVPLLLAAHEGKKTFNEGMRLLGNFVIQEVKISPDEFVFIDGAGGNENRLTPKAEIQLLEYIKKQPKLFKSFFDALPILGVDGSLEDFGKKTKAVGKVRAKTGTGAAYNLAIDKYFLITQALAGYMEGKNGHHFAFVLIVNNASMPSINDVFAIFEDQSQLSSMIYAYTE